MAKNKIVVKIKKKDILKKKRLFQVMFFVAYAYGTLLAFVSAR